MESGIDIARCLWSYATIARICVALSRAENIFLLQETEHLMFQISL